MNNELIFLLIVNIIMFFLTTKSPIIIDNVGLNPYLIIKNKEYYRLVLSKICHLDFKHLFYNMLNLIILYYTLGSKINFSKYIFFHLIIFNIIYISISYLLYFYFKKNYYYNCTSVGFSGIIFGLLHIKYLLCTTTLKVCNFIIPPEFAVFYDFFISYIESDKKVNNFGHFVGIITSIILIKYSGINFINKI